MVKELSPEACFVINFLNERGRTWTTAKAIQTQSTFSGGKAWDRRTVAAIAEECDGRIISCTRGYMLDIHASEEDILLAYSEIFRKALGSEKRARRIIANARRRGLLNDRGVVDRTREKIATELKIQHREQHYPEQINKRENWEEQDLFQISKVRAHY